MVKTPEPTPEQIVASLPDVTNPTGLKVTLTEIVPGVGRLNQKTAINLEGLFTFFDLDPTTQSSPATWTSWCLAAKGSYVSGAGVYKGGAFTATTTCP